MFSFFPVPKVNAFHVDQAVMVAEKLFSSWWAVVLFSSSSLLLLLALKTLNRQEAEEERSPRLLLLSSALPSLPPAVADGRTEGRIKTRRSRMSKLRTRFQS